MRPLFLLACALHLGAQALPNTFLAVGGAYSRSDSPKVSQFASVGKLISGSTYVLTTVQAAGRETRLIVEGCQHIAQAGPLGLWAFVGLTGANNSTGGLTAGGMVSLKPWKQSIRPGFEAGIRTVTQTSSSMTSRQVHVALVWEFP